MGLLLYVLAEATTKTPADASWWANFGVAGAALAAVGVATWVLLNRVGTFLAPLISKAFEKLSAFIEHLQKSMTENTKVSERSVVAIERLTETLRLRANHDRRTHRALTMMASAARMVTDNDGARQLLQQAIDMLQDEED